MTSEIPAYDEKVYLRAQTKFEPLVCGWYAWTHLVSPLQHAMNVAFRHIPLLRSFLKNPQTHIAAARDPTLFGGPFVALALEDRSRVEQLLAVTQNRCAPLLRLAEDLKALDRRVQELAHGYSMQELYRRPPDSLSGLVEFLYDLNNQPKVRLCEELLYDEELGIDTQEIGLSLTAETERDFFMSTPRLPGADRIILRLPFRDARLDALLTMRSEPGGLASIADALGVPEEERGKFARFFTRTAPAGNPRRYDGEGVRLRYFGHACVLVETATTAILIDPMLALESHPDDGRLTFADLPRWIDFVILSHNHQDHCSPEMLLQLRSRIGRIIVPRNNAGSPADPSMKLALRALGFAQVEEVNPFDCIRFPEGAITSLPFPGEHVDLDVHARHGIHIEAKGRRFAFLVDSDGWDAALYTRVARRMGKELDGLFLGMECHGAPLSWLYGPLLTKAITRRDDESRRLSGLNAERAWNVTMQFQASRVFVYAMGQEPWLRYIMGLQYTPESIQLKEVAAFLEQCARSQLSAENLYISRELHF